MKRAFLISLFLYIPTFLYAHNPQISTIVLAQNRAGQWNVLIGSSLSAFQYALQTKGLLKESDTLQAAAFQKMILEHLRENIQIRANGHGPIELKRGMVILNHQTDVRFDLSGMPQQLQTITIRQGSFASLRNHYCILKIFPDGGSVRSFILQESNDFMISLKLNNNELVEAFPEKHTNWAPWLGMVGILMLLGTYLFLHRRNKVLVA
ncbi:MULTISPECIES: LPXTG cell wall anchor domain-containing protein [unclassified Spirosoma]|uniref:LPXTG cell wall anchor domain-containing protein n=1 Tax=unclassified Spirosoma TaxID=2621999 RepID=UPI001ACF5252|nr:MULTISPECIES: LPXTG cell wall anchor domain-containing protein [unclassified Spirosoma]MBN8823043.1 LPXTG cell wall anchor domain-containing protein [Spirosoma sp.]